VENRCGKSSWEPLWRTVVANRCDEPSWNRRGEP
jgi:hypothetical protein